jgi:hypothetical protein
MAAKHARHDMRKDKNFKGSDPSELTAQSLYCGAGIGIANNINKLSLVGMQLPEKYKENSATF